MYLLSFLKEIIYFISSKFVITKNIDFYMEFWPLETLLNSSVIFFCYFSIDSYVCKSKHADNWSLPVLLCIP